MNLESARGEKYFGAFVMTYERPNILRETIAKMLAQTCPPEKILVVDNSDSLTTQRMIEDLQNPAVLYYRVGHNAGPAGAARIGLMYLANEGYRWINWGDDDNPPVIPDTFERLLQLGDELIANGSRIGAVGITGSIFNTLTCKLKRLQRNLLPLANEVDVIPANKLIIHSNVVIQGILPNDRLFFGFEEMDFSLRMRRKKFKLICHGELLQQHRELFGTAEAREVRFGIDNEYQRWRRYYGYRNLLYILARTNSYFWTAAVLIFRIQVRTVSNLRFGWKYFRSSAAIYWQAIKDGLSGHLGRSQNLNKDTNE